MSVRLVVRGDDEDSVSMPGRRTEALAKCGGCVGLARALRHSQASLGRLTDHTANKASKVLSREDICDLTLTH